ncbi:hypothetical protein STAQ_17460 [Allostella sp. ATCC 35155]|nr:hypothetical protein STAQ_17460 [Stella sp. ATCC 35155]
MRDPGILQTTEIEPAVIAVRLAAALAAGACIGIDREWRQKPAGLRTHMLIALAAAVFTIIAIELHLETERNGPTGSSDPIRIIEAVTAGVAFLGAGAIFRGGGTVKGITTGAGIWLAGALGLACGAGYGPLALIATLLTIIVLTVIGRLERMAQRERPAEPDRCGNPD